MSRLDPRTFLVFQRYLVQGLTLGSVKGEASARPTLNRLDARAPTARRRRHSLRPALLGDSIR